MKNLFLTAYLIVHFSSTSFASTIEICKITSSKINETLPIKKDRITTLREAGCVPGNPKNRLSYILEVDLDIDLAKQIDLIKEIKPGVLKTYCTDPQIRPVLTAFDIDHRYYTLKGEYAGSFLMTLAECPK